MCDAACIVSVLVQHTLDLQCLLVVALPLSTYVIPAYWFTLRHLMMIIVYPHMAYYIIMLIGLPSGIS